MHLMITWALTTTAAALPTLIGIAATPTAAHSALLAATRAAIARAGPGRHRYTLHCNGSLHAILVTDGRDAEQLLAQLH